MPTKKPVVKKRPKYYVPAVAKTLQVLETLAGADTPATLQSLTHETHLPKSSIYAILATLEMHQYVERDGANAFRLGPRALHLGTAKQTTNLSQLFHTESRRIVEECGETVQMAILDQSEVIYIAREDGNQPVQLVSQIGKRLPAYATALGKALLATLPDSYVDALFAGRTFATLTPSTISSLAQLKTDLGCVRERGYAHDDQESAIGLQCLAAPILNHTGQAVAAISVSFLSARATPEHFQHILQLVQTAARDMSSRMGWRLPVYELLPAPVPQSSEPIQAQPR